MTTKINAFYILALLMFLFATIVDSVPWAIWGLGLMAVSLFDSWKEAKQETTKVEK